MALQIYIVIKLKSNKIIDTGGPSPVSVAKAKPSLMNSIVKAENKKKDELGNVLNNVKKIVKPLFGSNTKLGNNNKSNKATEEHKDSKKSKSLVKDQVTSAMLCLLAECPKDDKNSLSISANNKTSKPGDKTAEPIDSDQVRFINLS